MTAGVKRRIVRFSFTRGSGRIHHPGCDFSHRDSDRGDRADRPAPCGRSLAHAGAQYEVGLPAGNADLPALSHSRRHPTRVDLVLRPSFRCRLGQHRDGDHCVRSRLAADGAGRRTGPETGQPLVPAMPGRIMAGPPKVDERYCTVTLCGGLGGEASVAQPIRWVLTTTSS